MRNVRDLEDLIIEAIYAGNKYFLFIYFKEEKNHTFGYKFNYFN